MHGEKLHIFVKLLVTLRYGMYHFNCNRGIFALYGFNVINAKICDLQMSDGY